MNERAIDNPKKLIHNRYHMAEEGVEYQPFGKTRLRIPKDSELYHPGKSFRSASHPSRRGLLAKIVAITAGALGAAWGGSELVKRAVDKDQKVQDSQIQAHEQQVQSLNKR